MKNKTLILALFVFTIIAAIIGGVLILKDKNSSTDQIELNEKIDLADKEAQETVKSLENIDNEMPDITESDFE